MSLLLLLLLLLPLHQSRVLPLDISHNGTT